MIRLFIVLVAVGFTFPAYSIVDTSTGAFTESWVDYDGKGLDLRIRLERTYNNRSNYKGWFGFGWCSDLETKLIADSSSVSVNHCGDGQLIEFKKKGSVFKTDVESEGTIAKQASTYTRSFKDGTVEVYSFKGKLTEIKKGLRFITLKYNEKGQIKELSDSGGRKVFVTTSPEGFITKLTFSHTSEGQTFKDDIATYTYANLNLVSATNYWGNTYKYEYDQDHNLVKAIWPGKKSIEITYNLNDWVKSLKGTDVCSESFDYKTDSTKNPPRYAITVKKTCPEGIIIERSYAYSYSLDNRRIVAAEIDENGIRREYKYDDEGNIAQVDEHRPRGKVTTKIIRNNKGQITKVQNDFEARTYQYKMGASRDLVTSVTIEAIALGHTVEKSTYSLSYDQEDRLISAIKPGNKRLAFKYDEEDRLAQVGLGATQVQMIYDDNKLEPRAVKLGQKELPVEIYSKKATPVEVAAVEMYLDYSRLTQVAIPSY